METSIRFHKLNRLAHDRLTERHGAVQGVQNNVGPLHHDPSQQVALFRDAKSRVGADVALQPKAKDELIERAWNAVPAPRRRRSRWGARKAWRASDRSADRIEDVDVLEVALIVGDNGAVVCFRDRGDDGVEGATRSPLGFALRHEAAPD